MNKKYLNEYECITGPDGKQKSIYSGPVYRMEIPGLKQIKVVLVLFALSLAALYIGMGITGNYSTRLVYVGLPYAVLVIPFSLLLYKTVRFYFLKEEMERRDYETVFMHMAVNAAIALSFSAFACIGAIIWLAKQEYVHSLEYMFPVLAFLFALIDFIFIKTWRRMQKRVQEV